MTGHDELIFQALGQLPEDPYRAAWETRAARVVLPELPNSHGVLAGQIPSPCRLELARSP